ncbi:MAG: hypothetical protein GWM87_06730 [Xanthomonadales bacterium]|nr:hypothetical protein [Xanthomonadales bacterium]NIX12660.1 hypothetical protein [Xanthomonadales bacterium]
MDKLVIPKIVWVAMTVMVLLIVVTGAAYWLETSQSGGLNNETPLYDLFSDAFKVGLGAFIGVLSQWASKVFGREEAS